MKINWNTVAKKVSVAEGLKKETNIAQIKEVLKCAKAELAKHSDGEIVEAIRRR